MNMFFRFVLAVSFFMKIRSFLFRSPQIGIRSKYMSTLPPTPTDFNKGFFIHRPEEPFELELTNPHPLDSTIKFDESSHTYCINGKPAKYSVTQLLGNFFTKFDADEIISKMMTSKNWPRSEYTFKNGTPYTAQNIKDKWNKNSEYSRNTGTWMHYNIERYMNKLVPSKDLPEMQQFYAFEDNYIVPNKIHPYRTEFKIADPELGLAGTVDFIGKFPDGTYVLIDWKRSKKLPTEMNNAFGKLGLHILQKHYNMHVSRMVLTSFHTDLENYFVAEVPNKEKEVLDILNTIQK